MRTKFHRSGTFNIEPIEAEGSKESRLADGSPINRISDTEFQILVTNTKIKIGMKVKGYIVEYEKEGRAGLVVIVAGSPEQAIEIARREKDTDAAAVIDEAEVIFAD